MNRRAFITGISGPELSAAEREFIRMHQPWGFILFKRNIETPTQVISLVQELRRAVSDPEAPVLIDQEGGRVQRLGPPHWPIYPPACAYGALFDRDPSSGLAAARLGARLIADDSAGDADPIIGDRAYGTDPAKVAAIAGAFAAGLMEGGVLPVLKHLPGHGRATADSHHRLPVVATERKVLESTDFAAFRPLAKLPLGMTAHVVFTAIDPVAPATTSVTMVREVIRGFIGFDGLLMSDDLSMNALSGTLAERARATLAAGCDVVLHCNGSLDERRQVANACPP